MLTKIQTNNDLITNPFIQINPSQRWRQVDTVKCHFASHCSKERYGRQDGRWKGPHQHDGARSHGFQARIGQDRLRSKLCKLLLKNIFQPNLRIIFRFPNQCSKTWANDNLWIVTAFISLFFLPENMTEIFPNTNWFCLSIRISTLFLGESEGQLHFRFRWKVSGFLQLLGWPTILCWWQHHPPRLPHVRNVVRSQQAGPWHPGEVPQIGCFHEKIWGAANTFCLSQVRQVSFFCIKLYWVISNLDQNLKDSNISGLDGNNGMK